MEKIEAVRNKLGLSQCQFVVMVVFFVMSLAGCCVVFLPIIQNTIITFGESLVQRPLNRPLWRERFVASGAIGIILHLVFFFTLFYKNIFENEKVNRKVYLFVIAYVAFSIFVIMFQANWTFGDDHQFITTTAINKYIMQFYGYGRFFHLVIFIIIFRSFFTVFSDMKMGCTLNHTLFVLLYFI
jgi:hypothetical protein